MTLKKNAYLKYIDHIDIQSCNTRKHMNKLHKT